MDLNEFKAKLNRKIPLTGIITSEDYWQPKGIAYGIAGFIKMTQLRAFFQPVDDLYKIVSRNNPESMIESEHIKRLVLIKEVLEKRVERKVISKDFGNLIKNIIDKNVLVKNKDFCCFYKLMATVICYHPYRHIT
jgi:hypothetical protein